jgi:hypothetical protein
MAYPPITTLPAAPSRQDPTNFADEADAFLGALPDFGDEANALGSYLDATAAAASAIAAAASATTAVNAANAQVWVSGASYDAGDVVYSPVTYQTYRAITTHSGETTDPSSDATNWVQLGGIDGLTATAAELNYNDITTLGLTEASKTVTADANGVVTFDNGISEDYTAVTSSFN